MWIPATLSKLSGHTTILGPDSVGQFARWTPGIVAIILTGILTGKQGVGALFRPLKIWRVNIGWYLFALLFQPALFVVAKLIDSLFAKTYEVTSPLTSVPYPIAFVIPVVILSAIPGAFMEELGWRGFALPRLQSKNTASIASVVLGIIWGVWHIPSTVFLGETNVPVIALAVLNTVPVTMLFTWLFNNTNGSLLLVTLYHASIQYTTNFLGMADTQTSGLLMWLVAFLVLTVAGAKHLSRISERVQSE